MRVNALTAKFQSIISMLRVRIQSYSYLNRLQSSSVLILLTIPFLISRLRWPCIARIFQFRLATPSKVCLYDFFSPYESYTLFQLTALHTYVPHFRITWVPLDSLYHLIFFLPTTLRLNSSILPFILSVHSVLNVWTLIFRNIELAFSSIHTYNQCPLLLLSNLYTLDFEHLFSHTNVESRISKSSDFCSLQSFSNVRQNHRSTN